MSNIKKTDDHDCSEHDETFSQLGEICYAYALDGLEEVLPAHLKNEQDMAEIEEVMAHSIEVTMMVFHQLLKNPKFKEEDIKAIIAALEEENFDEADRVLLGDEQAEMDHH